MVKAINKAGLIGSSETVTKVAELLAKAKIQVVANEERVTTKLTNTDLIIEFLDHPRKRAEVLGKAAASVKADAVLATSALGGITELASAINRRDRVIGLNFTFNPFEDKCLVQIVKGLETSMETIDACKCLLEKAGTTAIVVEDLPGLVLDRTLASLVNEAAEMYATEVANIEDIDRVTRLCLNWPMGPFEFADYLGIDNVVATLEMIARDEPQYTPSRLLRQMVAAGKLGRKVEQGFYSYT